MEMLVKFNITFAKACEKEIPWRPLNRRLGGLQTWPGSLEKRMKFLLLPEIK
jgi:hypothetical protein